MDILVAVVWLLVGAVAVGGVGILAFLAIPFPRPFVTESDYSHHTSPYWQFCYGHKYIRPARKPVRGAGLTAHFENQDFEFDAAPLRESRQITIAAVGDLMARRDLLGKGSSNLWTDVGARIFEADLSIGNLEFAVNPNLLIDKLLRYSVPYEFAEVLVGSESWGQFDFLSLANNHMNDSLKEGIACTCEYLDGKGIRHAGASGSAEEQKEVTLIELSGIKIALLSYTFSTNNIDLDEGHEFGINLVRFNALNDDDYDPSMIHGHIEAAKAKGADYIIACNHWANDLELYPPPQVVSRAHDLLDAGVDLIIGHHSHVPGKMERYRTRDGRDSIVCYSLGNFTSRGLLFPWQRTGQILNLTLEIGLDGIGEKTIRPRQVSLTPVYHSMNKVRGDDPTHRIVPLLEGARLLKEGRAPAHFSRMDRRQIPELAESYRKNFTVRGIVYR